MENNLPYDLIENCTKQCSREMLYKDPLNLNSERRYHEASTVEIKHYDPEVDKIPEKFLEPNWQKISRSSNVAKIQNLFIPTMSTKWKFTLQDISVLWKLRVNLKR